MAIKMFKNFYDCINDLACVLGVSHLDEMDVAIKMALDGDFPSVATYFQDEAARLRWHVKREYEDDPDNDKIAHTG
jgi:hypothetical protein